MSRLSGYINDSLSFQVAVKILRTLGVNKKKKLERVGIVQDHPHQTVS